jgi:uncharacterized membrane protein YcjF (UPF0283 family)
MEKSEKELLSYTVKMYQRGDSWRDIVRYLERNTSDKDTIARIVRSMSALDDRNKVKKRRHTYSLINILVGMALIFVGVFLIWNLWDRGFVALLPCILVFTGIVALCGNDGKKSFFNH